MSYGGLLAISLVLSLMGFIPFAYLTYLILQKIEGTEIMWFLFVLWIPFYYLSAIMSKVTDWVKMKMEAEKR